MTTTATLSTFVQTPTKIIEALEEGDVLLTRRSGESLRLSKAVTSEREMSSMQSLARLIAASLDDDTAQRIAERLVDPYPWVEFLPTPARHAFVTEFLRVARACAAVGHFDRLAITLEAWEATAEAYADPQVRVDGVDLMYLSGPDVVEVPRPTA